MRDDLPNILALHNYTVFDQHFDQFFEVKRINLCVSSQRLHKFPRQVGYVLQNLSSQLTARIKIKIIDRDDFAQGEVDSTVRMGFIEAGARRAQNEQGQIDLQFCQIFDQLQRAIISPMNIVEQKNDR